MNKQLYQVHVVFKGKPMPIGPKTNILRAAQRLRDVIQSQIRSGREKHWTEPMVLKVS